MLCPAIPAIILGEFWTTQGGKLAEGVMAQSQHHDGRKGPYYWTSLNYYLGSGALGFAHALLPCKAKT
jgi:hypothetical protein